MLKFILWFALIFILLALIFAIIAAILFYKQDNSSAIIFVYLTILTSLLALMGIIVQMFAKPNDYFGMSRARQVLGRPGSRYVSRYSGSLD